MDKNNMLCNDLGLFLLVSIIIYGISPKSTVMDPQAHKNVIIKAIFFGLLAVAAFEVGSRYEMFHFEVTPWKKTCIQGRDRCPQCCGQGMVGGIPINFEYTGDRERMNASMTCSQRAPGMANNPDSYYSLGQYSEGVPLSGPDTVGVEGYCESGCGYGSSMNGTLAQAYANTESLRCAAGQGRCGASGTMESYCCDDCNLPSPPSKANNPYMAVNGAAFETQCKQGCPAGESYCGDCSGDKMRTVGNEWDGSGLAQSGAPVGPPTEKYCADCSGDKYDSLNQTWDGKGLSTEGFCDRCRDYNGRRTDYGSDFQFRP